MKWVLFLTILSTQSPMPIQESKPIQIDLDKNHSSEKECIAMGEFLVRANYMAGITSTFECRRTK